MGFNQTTLTMKERSTRKFAEWYIDYQRLVLPSDLRKENLISSTFTLFIDYRMHHILIEFIDNRNSWEKKNMHQNMVVER